MTVRHGEVVMRGKGVTVRYQPANRRGDLRPASKNRAMDDFLMSDRVQDVADKAAKDIARDAAELAAAETSKTGKYASSFETESMEPIVAAGNPRRASRVVNSDVAAVPVEFGNRRVGAGKRILWRAGEPYHTPRGIA